MSSLQSGWRTIVRRSASAGLVPLVPVACDVDAPADPHPVVTLDVVEEAAERGKAPGTADEAAMEPDRQHLRAALALGIEHVETIAQIGEELLARVETLRR